ncbi:MAG: PocR ligand-binding domain-containing protein [Oscillospiraceae bacterium]|nr:PocR ligand-binding domain-containing protein [Oscillospiraceae bacterium]
MKIQDFCDMEEFERLMDTWAKSTGLATVAVDAEGKYISDCYNFTEFCIDLTRGSTEGRRRCEKCDAECTGIYECHAGLMDFSIPITLKDGTVLGSVIGGQVLPQNPDENKFRATALELGIDPERYITALHRVNVRTPEEIEGSATLLGNVINMFVRASYSEKYNTEIVDKLVDGIAEAAAEINVANESNKKLTKVSMNQKILGINASIESAHAGAAGKGFAIVATEVQKLAVTMEKASTEITASLSRLTQIINGLKEE